MSIVPRSDPRANFPDANAASRPQDPSSVTQEGTLVLEHALAKGSRLFEWHNTPLIDDAGETIGVTSLVRDVTDSLAEEQALRESQKLESLGLLAGGVAHDFNNMLAALLGNADLALMKAGRSSPAIEHIEQVIVTAERAAELTRQLLNYSGQASYEMQPLELDKLLDEMASLLAVSISKRVSFSLRTSSSLPAVLADASQLRQIAMNLVINAAEAIGDTSGEIRVITSALTLDEPLDDAALKGGPLQAGPYVRLVVEDTGRGMSAEIRERIFDPFFSTKASGRGLGLAAILGIVRSHHGALRVESKPGEGTRFELFFPAIQSSVAEREEAQHEALQHGRGRILVVDDEASVRRMVSNALSTVGYEVIAADNGDEALELFERDEGGFDLVLTDLMMPGLNGHELFFELVSRVPALPVILSSAFTDEPGTTRYPDGRAPAFLKKPYRLRKLVEQVGAEIGRHAQ